MHGIDSGTWQGSAGEVGQLGHYVRQTGQISRSWARRRYQAGDAGVEATAEQLQEADSKVQDAEAHGGGNG